MALSDLKKFPNTSGRGNLQPILDRDENNWRSQNVPKELVETVSIIRFILDDTKRSWYNNLEILIKISYDKGDRFTSKDIYENFENILQQKYPLNYTIKASIRANLQVLRDKGIIDFIDDKGNYILIN